MENSKNITILFILSIIGCTIYSQSSSNFSQFFLQDYSYNSSLIGTDDNSLNVNLIHRQWGTLNYDSSPYSEFLGFETSFFKKTKLGLSGQYIRDFEGQAFTNNKFNIGVSGNQEMGNHYIGMGLSLNYSNQLFNPIEFENMESGDQALLNGQQSFNMLAPAFGLNYKFDNSKNFMFQLGASSTNTTDLLNDYSKSILKYISDEFNISLKTKFGSLSGLNGEIQALYRGNGGFDNYTGWTNTRSPRSISGVVLFNNFYTYKDNKKFSGGISFNGFFLENDRFQNLSFSPIVLFQVENWKFGVSYDYGFTNLQTYNNGIVELSVSYNPNIKRSQNSTTINEEDVEEDNIEEKPKKKTKKIIALKTPQQKLNTLLLNFDVEILYLINGDEYNRGFNKIEFNGDEDGDFKVSLPGEDGFLNLSGNHLMGGLSGVFKLKVNSNIAKDYNTFYEISISENENSKIVGIPYVIKPKLPVSIYKSLSCKLPSEFQKVNEDYFLLIRCYNSKAKSDYLKIPFLIKDY
jgi:type IX secretion system PorP/SprF family membrane protein